MYELLIIPERKGFNKEQNKAPVFPFTPNRRKRNNVERRMMKRDNDKVHNNNNNEANKRKGDTVKLEGKSKP